MPFPSQERFSWRPWAGLAIGLATSLALWTGHAEEPKHPLSVGPALLPEKTDTGSPSPAENRRLESLKFALSTARFDASTRDYVNAEKNYLLVLAEDSPDEMQKTALFELGVTVQAENDLPRAQSIFSQYQQRWSGDARAPEICLHQGQIFRGMGMNRPVRTQHGEGRQHLQKVGKAVHRAAAQILEAEAIAPLGIHQEAVIAHQVAR